MGTKSYKTEDETFMINILATLRFNIKAFGLLKGLRLPVYIYGSIKLRNIGKIDIKCPVRRGLWVIGLNHRSVVAPFTMFDNQGVIEVHGSVFLNFGSMLSNHGTIVFNGYTLIGNKSEIRVYKRLEVGCNTSFGFDTHIMDSDMHYVVDVESRRVFPNTAPIRIGNYNWFGSNCFIKKGVVTPDYLIVASPNALLTKDYSNLPPHTVLAGVPAKPIGQGLRRVYNFCSEKCIRQFFKENQKASFYQVGDGIGLDEFCGLT